MLETMHFCGNLSRNWLPHIEFSGILQILPQSETSLPQAMHANSMKYLGENFLKNILCERESISSLKS
jgi:hypothetical protein